MQMIDGCNAAGSLSRIVAQHARKCAISLDQAIAL